MLPRFFLLHVEDNDFAASSTEVVLRHFNASWVIERASNLESGVDLLKANPKKFGLVILDLRLPGVAGLEGLKRIMEIATHIPVVIYTATADPDLEDRAFELGAQSYIYKPCDNDELYRKLKRAVVRFYGTLERCKPEPLIVDVKAPFLDKKSKIAITTAAIVAAIGAFIAGFWEVIKSLFQKN